MRGMHRSTDLCDCPYAGTTRDIKGTSDSRNEKRKKDLSRELRKTKEDIFLIRKVLAESQSKLATFKRILNLELGFSVSDPFMSLENSWRDRIREKAYLKSELVKLVDYLRECDACYRVDPVYHPTRLSTSTEDGMGQGKALDILAASESEEALRDFFKLKKDYEDKLYCNKVMEKEIAAAKERISELQEQYLQDKSLIDFATTHHFRSKRTVGDGASCHRDRPDAEEASQDKSIIDPEALKFKALWENSEMDKKKVKKSIEALSEKLDLASQKIVRAENVCSKNIATLRNLVLKLRNNVLLSKVVPKKDGFGKYSVVEFRLGKTQLEAAKDENEYLRNFLSKVVSAEGGECGKLQNSLKSSAEKYRIVLENVRNNLSAKEPAQTYKSKPLPEK